MNKTKAGRLEQRGWKKGTVDELLGLTPEEAALIEMKLSLSRSVRARRLDHNLTQVQVAKMLGSSQSRVAKMESADPTVTFDLLVRSCIALGATPADLARVIARSQRSSTA